MPGTLTGVGVRAGLGGVRVGGVCSGQYTDPETGLIYLRARWYDPTTAQFLIRDPLVDLTRSAYGYVGGNPLNATDPLGLSSCGFSFGGLFDCASKVGNAAGNAASDAGGWVADNSEAIGQVASGAAAGLSILAGGCTIVLPATGVGEAVCGGIEVASLTAGGIATVADSIAAAQGRESIAIPVLDTVGLGFGVAGRLAPIDGFGIWTSGLGKVGLGVTSAIFGVGAFVGSFLLHGSEC